MILKKLLSGTIVAGSTVWVKLATKISYLEPKYQTQLHYIHLPYTYLFLLNETPTPYYMYYFLHQDILIVFCFYHEINGVFLSCRNISTKLWKSCVIYLIKRDINFLNFKVQIYVICLQFMLTEIGCQKDGITCKRRQS